MGHRYGQEIQVAGSLEAKRPPRAFGWRGALYQIVEVLATWHLRDRWWQTDGSAALSVPSGGSGWLGASDRTYYRVRCLPALFCEIYYDAVTGAWVLDRVCD